MKSLESKFEAFLRTNRLAHKGQTILLAVSGGVDSLVMLRLFRKIQSSWDLRLGIVHVNHQLRGSESDQDESFVSSVAKQFALPFYTRKFNTSEFSHEHHLTKQEAAREIRYKFFEEMRTHMNAKAVATAHQANDNAETVLLNIIRGTGIRGLAGIPLKRDRFIRPLLFAYRDEIERFAMENSILYRHDSSNDSLSYDRNFLRLRILPRLVETHGPGVVASLNKAAAAMRRVDSMVRQRVNRQTRSVAESPKGVEINIPQFRKQPDFMQEEILLKMLRDQELEPTEEKISAVLDLCGKSTGARRDLGKGFTIFRDRERLVLTKDEHQRLQTAQVAVGQEYNFATFHLAIGTPEPMPQSLLSDTKVEFVDAEKLGGQLLVRGWNNGDWFVPLGLRHRKKLSDFFVDEKVPLFEKSMVPVLESRGDIVWVCGRRLDDRFKVTKRTRSVIRLTFSPLN